MEMQIRRRERDSWTEMFSILQKLTGQSKKELNSEEWKEFFIAIEKWGYYEHMRRFYFDDNDPSGVFWENKI